MIKAKQVAGQGIITTLKPSHTDSPLRLESTRIGKQSSMPSLSMLISPPRGSSSHQGEPAILHLHSEVEQPRSHTPLLNI